MELEQALAAERAEAEAAAAAAAEARRRALQQSLDIHTQVSLGAAVGFISCRGLSLCISAPFLKQHQAAGEVQDYTAHTLAQVVYCTHSGCGARDDEGGRGGGQGARR